MAHSSARWDAGSQIIITRVLAAPNHHAVLGIRPNATAAEMRTARKKLMVALHPDRNKAPGAEDAFKKVNEAYNQALPAALRAERCGRRSLGRRRRRLDRRRHRRRRRPRRCPSTSRCRRA